MNWMRIDNSADLNSLLEGYDWGHAFIREAHLVSPSYIEESKSVVAPDLPPCLRVLIVFPSDEGDALELLFTEVSDLGIWFGGGLNPFGTVSPAGVSWRFSSSADNEIRCAEIMYRSASDSSVGHALKYGWEELFDKGGLLSLKREFK